jgi:Rrf2 family protein
MTILSLNYTPITFWQVLTDVMSMLSATAEYALRAVIHLARQGAGAALQATELADATEAPLSYMRKILHELVRAGVLDSTRGKHGGFRLAVHAENLPLFDIVTRFDQLEQGRRCLLGRQECSDRNPCPVHDRWKAAAEHVAAFFSETTVGDVLGGASKDRRGRSPRGERRK